MENLLFKSIIIGFDSFLFFTILGSTFNLYEKERLLNSKIAINCMNRGSIVYTKEEPTENSDIILGSQVISEVWDYEGNKQVFINNTDVTSMRQDISYLSRVLSMTGKYIKKYENQGSLIRYVKL